MKPTNPMAQLRQWKENNVSKNGSVNLLKFEETNAPKIGPVDVPQNMDSSRNNRESIPEKVGKKKYQGKLSINPLAFQLSQMTRQFKLIQDSNQRCFDVFPDDFHHKLKMREEMADLVERLKDGGKLLNSLANQDEHKATLKNFNQANGYLIVKFNELIDQIDYLHLERMEQEKNNNGQN